MGSNTFVLIVEDKPSEAAMAVEAVKGFVGVVAHEHDPECNGLYLGLENIREKLGNPDCRGYRTSKGGMLFISVAKNLKEARTAFRFRENKPNDGVAERWKRIYENIAVVTDLMFPAYDGGKEQANGIEVVLMAIEHGFPVAICSDTDHHEVAFLPKLVATLVPLHPRKISVILDKKDWHKAVAEVLVPPE